MFNIPIQQFWLKIIFVFLELTIHNLLASAQGLADNCAKQRWRRCHNNIISITMANVGEPDLGKWQGVSCNVIIYMLNKQCVPPSVGLISSKFLVVYGLGIKCISSCSSPSSYAVIHKLAAVLRLLKIYELPCDYCIIILFMLCVHDDNDYYHYYKL